MAIGGKTLGIVSGLAVGLTSGVILAALNPIVPPKGNVKTDVAIDDSSAGVEETESADPALPKLSMVDPKTDNDVQTAEDEPAVEELAPVEKKPEIAAVEENITEPLDKSEPPKLSEADKLGPVEDPDTELAMVLPENASVGDLDAAPEQPSAAQGDKSPKLSTKPADAVQLAEPDLETDGPSVANVEPNDNADVETAAVAAPESLDEPLELSTNAPSVATLPTIADPEAPEPAAAIVEEVVEEEQPNTSGTFKTTGGSIITRGAQLPKIGEDSETGLAALRTGKSNSRFKTIGDSVVEPAPSETLSEENTDAGALVRNANEFPVTDSPLLSIILIDDGKIADQLPSLQGLNLPLTIAVSLDEPDAGQKAQMYRDAGFEVLAMTPRDVKLSLSGGQSNAQVAALLSEYFEIMPTAVGLIDRPSANLQKDQRLSRAVVKEFAKSGHGLVTYAGGLNGTKRIAEQENVASGTIFRFVDKSGEAGPIVTQQLDRAAREARSKGAVMIMATPSKATLGTLVSWSLSSKARAVTLAPVSAALLKN